MADAALGCTARFERIDEIPFEPERKRLVTRAPRGGEPVLFVKGAPEERAAARALGRSRRRAECR